MNRRRLPVWCYLLAAITGFVVGAALNTPHPPRNTPPQTCAGIDLVTGRVVGCH